MNPRSVNIVLLALVLGLLGTIGYMAYVMKMNPPLGPGALDARVVTNTVTQIAVRKVYPTNFLASLGKLPISWKAIESTNYQAYIANLRSIGCPEETIADLVIRDCVARESPDGRTQTQRFFDHQRMFVHGSLERHRASHAERCRAIAARGLVPFK